MPIVSLGFSCQTRLLIDEVTADHRALPFDFTVATRAGLLAVLRSRGESFVVEAAQLSRFTMPVEGREGLSANGLFFWHDYPLDGGALSPAWPDAVGQANDKYRFLWARFAALIADPAIPKRFLVANTQENLPEYATGDFDADFALTPALHAELVEALCACGCAEPSITFLHRSLDEMLATRAGVSDPRFTSRFGGVLPLPGNPRIAAIALARPTGPSDWIRSVAGPYQDGWLIEPSGPATATVYRDAGDGPLPAGELSAVEDGLLGVFADAPNHVMRAVPEGGDLYFGTGTWGPKLRWRR